MAKSSRASSIKSNRTAFRKNVSGPKELERLDRLNAKLAEVAAKPAPAREEKMEVEAPGNTTAQKREKRVVEDVMDMDCETKSESNIEKKNPRKTPSRIQKKRRSKPHSQISFPSLQRRQQRKSSKK